MLLLKEHIVMKSTDCGGRVKDIESVHEIMGVELIRLTLI